MERLTNTKENRKGQEPFEYWLKDSHPLGQIKAIERLADYEDAEEQGLFLRLPCPIGTKVYALVDECEEMYEPSSWYTIISEEKFDFYMIDVFGKEVFLTREEAESALAEKGGAE